MFTQNQLNYFHIPLLISGIILFISENDLVTMISFIVSITCFLIVWLGNYNAKVGFPFLWKIHRFLNKDSKTKNQ